MAPPRKTNTRRGRKTVSKQSGGHKSRNNQRGRNRRYLSRRNSEFQIPLNVPRNLQSLKFDIYIKRILKKVKPRMKIKKETVQMMDNLMKDTLHQIATHASSKLGRRKTLKAKNLMKVLKKVMPKNLGEKVDTHAQKVLHKYSQNSRR